MRRAGLLALAACAAATLALPPAVAASPSKQPKKRPKPVVVQRGYSVIAVARGPRVPVYARPGAKKPLKTYRRPLHVRPRQTFLVDWPHGRFTWPAWVRVHLPERPNGSTAWVRSSSVKFLLNPYRVHVDLLTHEMTVWRRGKVWMRVPIGVGRAATPTPQGRYYLVKLIRPPNPRGAYGPYAFSVSAYSPVLTRFAGGPGQVGIHGTNRPHLVGKRVSHGCIRVDNAVIRRLARQLPLGTRVEIRWNTRPRGPSVTHAA